MDEVRWPFNVAVGLASFLTVTAPVLTTYLPLGALLALGVLVGALWLAIGGWWCVCSIASWVKPQHVGSRWRLLEWWAAPVLALLLFDSHGARIVRFWITRPEMERELAAMVARVGSRALDEPAHFPQPFGNPFDHNGFAWLPSPPPTEYDYHYTHLVGRWYMYFDP